jgi:hypothetical protein
MFGIVVNNPRQPTAEGAAHGGARGGSRRLENGRQQQPQLQPPPPPQQQRTAGSLRAGLVLHDDDLGGASVADAAAGAACKNPSAAAAFPALAAPSAKLEKVAWVKAKPPAAAFTPLGAKAAAQVPQRPVAESGLVQRNLRLQHALGLSAGGSGGGSSVDAATAATRAAQTATAWPFELRQWARAERGEVVKLERKVAELLADPRATSTAIKAMVRRCGGAAGQCANALALPHLSRSTSRFLRASLSPFAA